MDFRASGVQLYSLYLSERGVELYLGEDGCLDGRLICSQQNYQNILEFGKDLAWHKGVPFINHVALEMNEGGDMHDR